MNTKLQVLVIEEEAVVSRSFDRTLSGNGYQAFTNLSGDALNTMIESVELKAVNDAEKQAGTSRKMGAMLKTIGMLIAAPFIALAYVIALPFIGLYQIVKLAYEAYGKSNPAAAGKLGKAGLFLKNVGLFLVSPFIALAYVFALPFVGFYMFAKLVLEARANKLLNA